MPRQTSNNKLVYLFHCTAIACIAFLTINCATPPQPSPHPIETPAWKNNTPVPAAKWLNQEALKEQTYVVSSENTRTNRSVYRGTAFHIATSNPNAAYFLSSLLIIQNADGSIQKNIALSNGEDSVPVKLLASDEESGLALFHSKNPQPGGLLLANPSEYRQGCKLGAAGFCMTFGGPKDTAAFQAVTGSVVSIKGNNTNKKGSLDYKFDAPVPTLGSPLVTEQGHVAGVASLRNYRHGQGQGLGISSEVIKDFLRGRDLYLK